MFATLKQSDIWREVTPLHLKTNMRIVDGDNRYASFLDEIGSGVTPVASELGPYKIKVPPQLVADNNSLEGLCNFVYEGFQDNWQDSEWLCSRAIMCPTCKAVDTVNCKMAPLLPGDERVYKSADTLLDQDKGFEFPTEFLNSFEASGT